MKKDHYEQPTNFPLEPTSPEQTGSKEGFVEKKETLQNLLDSETLERTREADIEAAGHALQELRKSLIKKENSDVKHIDEKKFVDANIPDYQRGGAGKETAVGRVLKFVSSVLEFFGKFKIEGKENYSPTGPALIIAPHLGNEAVKLFAIDSRLRLVADRRLVWERQRGIIGLLRRFFMRRAKMLSVSGSLRNLDERAREDLLTRLKQNLGISQATVDGYQRVITEEGSEMQNRRQQEINAIVAVLAQKNEKGKHCERVAIFPTGLLLYEGEEEAHMLHKAYSGAERIAQRFKEVTGEELPIVPLGISRIENTVKIGVPFTLSDLEESSEGQRVIDQMMVRVAKLMPLEERGYYTK